MKNKRLLIIGVIVLLFIITNPSITAFKNYLGVSGYYGLKRPVNLFVCSIYESGTRKYLGIVGNFWWLNEPMPVKFNNIATDSALMDSAKMDTSIHPKKVNDPLGILKKH